eukprot:13641016-Alexandrium_andersonii.AAC.1
MGDGASSASRRGLTSMEPLACQASTRLRFRRAGWRYGSRFVLPLLPSRTTPTLSLRMRPRRCGALAPARPR